MAMPTKKSFQCVSFPPEKNHRANMVFGNTIRGATAFAGSHNIKDCSDLNYNT